MNSGLVIFTGNLNSATDFYTNVFGFTVRESDKTYVALESNGFELVLLETEESRTMKTSASPKEYIPLKPVYFVEKPLSEIVRDGVGQAISAH